MVSGNWSGYSRLFPLSSLDLNDYLLGKWQEVLEQARVKLGKVDYDEAQKVGDPETTLFEVEKRRQTGKEPWLEHIPTKLSVFFHALRAFSSLCFLAIPASSAKETVAWGFLCLVLQVSFYAVDCHSPISFIDML